MTFEVFKWAVALASLWGVWWNIRRDRRAFGVWLCTNSVWTAVDLYHGVYSQAALQAVYAGLSVYGLYRWKEPPPA
jgi:hypothetical protein